MEAGQKNGLEYIMAEIDKFSWRIIVQLAFSVQLSELRRVSFRFGFNNDNSSSLGHALFIHHSRQTASLPLDSSFLMFPFY